jgi:ribosome modulation factor
MTNPRNPIAEPDIPFHKDHWAEIFSGPVWAHDAVSQWYADGYKHGWDGDLCDPPHTTYTDAWISGWNDGNGDKCAEIEEALAAAPPLRESDYFKAREAIKARRAMGRT